MQRQQTLPTADHQAVEPFRPNDLHQRSRRIVGQAATVQFEKVDLHATPAKRLGEELAAALAAHDQYLWIGPGQRLRQSWQRQQRFTVVTPLGPADVQPVGFEDRPGGATDAEPGLTERGLRPVAIEQFQAQAGGRLADHDDGAIAIQLEDRCTLLGGLRQRLDRQQRQAGAVHTSLGESRGQCLAFLGRPGQQQAPAGHA